MENENVNPEYKKGFNQGYAFAKHMPELVEELGKASDQSPRGQGFSDGRSQYTNEKLKEMRPSWLKGERKSTEQSKSSKAPKRDIDPDR